MSSTNRLWVADRGNNRVLRFENAATKVTGAPADGVFGQKLFDTNSFATGADRMCFPRSVLEDSEGNLWVADTENCRVLRFANVAAKLNGGDADVVLGQPNFADNTEATNAEKMNRPTGLAISAGGTLWIVDSFNSRVLRFDNAVSKSSGASADGVLGQPNFTSAGGGTSISMFHMPSDVALDASGVLYVSNYDSNRVVFFKNAAAKGNGAGADGVLGQPDFNTSTPQVTANGMDRVEGIALDSAGRLYVAQRFANRVTRYSLPVLVDSMPRITVIGKKKRETHKSTYKLRGTAISAVGLADVQYRVNKQKAYKSVQGTTSWFVKVRKLKIGMNKVTVRAISNDSKIANQIVRIKRTL